MGIFIGDHPGETTSVRAYSNTSMYNAPLHAHRAVHASAKGAGNRETPRESLRVSTPALPKVSLLSSDLIPFLTATVQK